jgi:DNA methyltransferase 1-associated protein 1
MQDNESTDYPETCTDYVKYNITVDMPDFTDEEYDAHLRSDDWSREETDYLFGIVKDYSYRWAVIWDRYEWQAIKRRERELAQAAQQEAGDTDSNALATLPFAPPRDKERSLEEMKARFYDISAKLMKLRIPEVQMDADQYSLYETLSKFDPVMERNRKMLATALINRNMDEVKEEEFLLTELQRINMAAVRLDAEREELRSRLDAPQQNTSTSAGLQSFTSSTALQALFQQLFQQDRSKKRASGTQAPGRLSLSANDMINTPSAQLSGANRRTSMALPPAAASQTPVKTLSPHQEHRFAVSTHERLTSGVTFGSDKLLKMRQAKSNVQTQKIGQALAELGIQEVIPIPTSRVADVFEQLVAKVGRLLDVRKVKEKEMGECRVLARMKAHRNGGNASTGDDTVKEEGGDDAKKEIADSQDTPMGDSNEDDNEAGNDDDAEGEDDTGAQNTPANADRDGNDDDDDDDDNDDDGDDAEEDNDASNTETRGHTDADDLDAEGEDESAAQTSRATSQGAGHKRSASELSDGSASASGPHEKRARK